MVRAATLTTSKSAQILVVDQNKLIGVFTDFCCQRCVMLQELLQHKICHSIYITYI